MCRKRQRHQTRHAEKRCVVNTATNYRMAKARVKQGQDDVAELRGINTAGQARVVQLNAQLESPNSCVMDSYNATGKRRPLTSPAAARRYVGQHP